MKESLSVAQARYMAGLQHHLALTSPSRSPKDASWASQNNHLGVDQLGSDSQRPPQAFTAPSGSSLRTRFAAVSSAAGIGRKGTRGKDRVLVGLKANLGEWSHGRGYTRLSMKARWTYAGRSHLRGCNGTDAADDIAGNESSAISPLQRFQLAAATVVRQNLRSLLAESPTNKRVLRRLGSFATHEGDLDTAVDYFRQATKNSTDDRDWVLLARAEVRAWMRDPAFGHKLLRSAVDAYRQSIDLLVPGLIQAWELPLRLFELGGVYESYGSFEGALSIYQSIASSMPFSSGFEDVLFRCAVVMRYLASLYGEQKAALLRSSREHLDIVIQGQTNRKGAPDESASLLYADVCRAEDSAEGRTLAATTYRFILEGRKRQGDLHAQGFRDWDVWIACPNTRVQLAREWARQGEPTLAVLSFEQAEQAFAKTASRRVPAPNLVEGRGVDQGLGYSELMDTAECFASFQRFERAREVTTRAAELDPDNPEAIGMMRALLGDAECRQKELTRQVALHIQSKWRTRVWHGEYLKSLRSRLCQELETRMVTDSLDVATREQLSYFFREKHRPVMLYEDQCANVIQKLGKAGLFRLRWFAIKRAAYRKQLASALKVYQKSPWTQSTREIVRSRANSKYTPASHKVVSVAALLDRQDIAVLPLQRVIRSMMARKMFRRMLRDRSKDLRRKQKQAVIRLQANVRRFLAYRERARRAQHAIDREKAAVYIQRVYRARAVQWMFAVQRAARIRALIVAQAQQAAALKIQATWRMKMGREEAQRHRCAIVDIQRAARGRQGRKEVFRVRNALVGRIQRQWKRRRDRGRMLAALLKMRIGREKKEAQAREVEKRFREMEERRKLGGSAGQMFATPADERRARRRKYALLSRMKAKSKIAGKATKWSLPQTMLQTMPTISFLQSASEQRPISRDKRTTSVSGDIADVIEKRGDASHQLHDDSIRHGEEIMSPPPASRPCTIPRAKYQITPICTARNAVNVKSIHGRNDAESLACARGVGGRLGSPLGSPHRAPGDWITGFAAAGASQVAAYKTGLSQEELSSEGEARAALPPPGSGLFPPFLQAAGSGSPVVYEIVQDAADDETARREELLSKVGSSTTKGLHGWHGLTLYRRPGVCSRLATFQQALQLRTIAFSPPSPQPLASPSPESTARPQTSNDDNENGLDGESPSKAEVTPQLMEKTELETPIFVGKRRRPSPLPKMSTFEPRDGNGTSRITQGLEPGTRRKRGPGSWRSTAKALSASFPTDLDVFKRTPCGTTDRSTSYGKCGGCSGSWSGFCCPLSVPTPPLPAGEFDSGDMVMVAGLLAHPESLLKRLLLHRAHLDSDAGREALLRCMELNKLKTLALGGCTGFQGPTSQRSETTILNRSKRTHWWDEFGETIRTNAFVLEELVIEGAETGGDTLCAVMGTVLSDFFIRLAGNLSSLSLVRCNISDEGAVAVAEGAAESPTLTHLDLSANAISDVGAAALANAIGEPIELSPKEGPQGDRMGKGTSTSCVRLKTLDLGQENRVTDAGGIALASALPSSESLELLTLSFNFISEEGGRALLKSAKGLNDCGAIYAALCDIQTEGNLFDDSWCVEIKAAVSERRRRMKSDAAEVATCSVNSVRGFVVANRQSDPDVVKGRRSRDQFSTAEVADMKQRPFKAWDSPTATRRTEQLVVDFATMGDGVGNTALPIKPQREKGRQRQRCEKDMEKIRRLLLRKIEQSKRARSTKDIAKLYEILENNAVGV